MGIAIDTARNSANATVLSPDNAVVKVMTIPTNEESVIAAATRALSTGLGKVQK